MKTICLILLVTLIRVVANGQSISISQTNDSLLLTKYQSNSAAILDSLIRFEFNKHRLKVLQNYNNDLIVEKTKLSSISSILSKQIDDCWFANNQLNDKNQKIYSDFKKLEEKNAKISKKNKRSGLEKWTWRGVTILGLIIKFSPYL